MAPRNRERGETSTDFAAELAAVEFGERRMIEPVAKAPKDAPPEIPAKGSLVTSLNDGLLHLPEFLFGAGESGGIEFPSGFGSWYGRTISGNKSACEENPELIEVARTLDFIFTRTSFVAWDGRHSDSRDAEFAKLTLRQRIARWAREFPEEAKAARAGVLLHGAVRTGAKKIAFAPARQTHFCSPQARVAAQVMHKYIVQPMVESKPVHAELQ